MFNMSQFENKLLELVSTQIKEAYDSLEKSELERHGATILMEIITVFNSVVEDAVFNVVHGLVLNLKQPSKKVPFYEKEKNE